MAIYTASLNSGSNGNCYYIGTSTEAILVDAGLSCRETEKRMKQLGLAMDKVRAIFISHEHTDHIKGVNQLSAKYELPVHISRKTLLHCPVGIRQHLVRNIADDESVSIGQLTVHAFNKRHDAADPFSFSITYNDITVGVFTDIGSPCDKLISNFSRCHAAYLETNYDEEMLEKGHYPVHLKRRIMGGNGHLSNIQALDLFCKYKPGFMTHLFPSHLSKDNNSPELVSRMFTEHAGETQVVVASRFESTPVFRIVAKGMQPGMETAKYTSNSAAQLSLF